MLHVPGNVIQFWVALHQACAKFFTGGPHWILESYRGPHQFLLDKTLFIPLKNYLKVSLNRYGVHGVISSVQTTNHMPATGLLKICELDAGPDLHWG